jgi:hypothetical protein
MTAHTEQLLAAAARRPNRSTVMGAFGLAVVGMMAVSGLAGDALSAGLGLPEAEIRFAARATGTVIAGGDLTSRPGGGESLARLAPGAPVRIGGLVRVPAGLGSRDVYWVAVSAADGHRHGFVAAEAVVVGQGSVPALSLDGVQLDALLSPAEAVSRSSEAPGGLAQVAGDGRAPVGAAAGAGSGAAAGAQAQAQPEQGIELSWLPASVARWREAIIAAARKHRVDPELVAIVALVESGGNPGIVSPAGAVGLMQIMPGTGAGIAQQLGIAAHDTSRLYDPAYNLDFGAYYLSQQLKSFGKAVDPDWQQSVEMAAVAYNGGPGAAQRLSSGGSIAAETRSYQRWVGGLWRERRHAEPPTLSAWLAAGGRNLVARAEQAQ